jgi:hypothetical protein
MLVRINAAVLTVLIGAMLIGCVSPALGDTAKIGRIELGLGIGLCAPMGDLNKTTNLGVGCPVTLGVRVTRHLLLGVEYFSSGYLTSDFFDLLRREVFWSREVTRTAVWARYLFPKTMSERDAEKRQLGFFVSGGAGSYKVKQELKSGSSTVFSESKPGFGFNIGGGLYMFAKTRRVIEGWGLALGLSLHYVEMDEPYGLYPVPIEYNESASTAIVAELNLTFTASFGR